MHGKNFSVMWANGSMRCKGNGQMLTQNIYLIGFMGCGKSSVAQALRKRYGFAVVEMDAEIERREQRTISEIFEQDSEAYFRQLETELLAEIAAQSKQVVSCGGGVVLRRENIVCMKQSGIVVLLTAEAETILQRVLADENRPLLKGKKSVSDIRQLMTQRETAYRQAADLTIATDEMTPTMIAEEIQKRMKG